VTALSIVTADGDLRRIDAERDADLFWACRGGGGGNFGIVTSFTLRTARARRAAYFTASWPGGLAEEALAAWQRFAPETDDRLTSIFSLSTGPQARALGVYLGDPGPLRRLLRPLENAGASVSVGAGDYLAVQRRFAGGTARTRFAAKSDYLARRLPAAGRRAAVAAVAGGPVSLLFDSYGGALNRPARDATAFVHRDSLCSIQYYAGSEGPVRRAKRRMRPYVSGEAYQNYIDPELDGWERAYYAENLERLRAVRAAVDPDRVFRFPQAI
jgi:FAD/FMN-containing dehydrogenase